MLIETLNRYPYQNQRLDIYNNAQIQPTKLKVYVAVYVAVDNEQRVIL